MTQQNNDAKTAEEQATEKALLLKETKERFANDRFATKVAGCEVVDVAPGYAKCQMKVTDDHRNALGGVMGGAVFTLADFAFAIAANTGAPDTVSIDAQITYLNSSKGNLLTAETFLEKAGRRICTYRISVTDETGAHVAEFISSGLRV